MENKRVGVIGIVIKDLKSASRINEILNEYSEIIIGRMGVPYREKKISVIALIVDGNTDEIGALTGKLGAVPEVTVKSALTR
ncbi:MAG TPA: iron-only hydrogenase system regulator [Spirochaetota bacterium]|nr:iron-only hydrogenase system regulator [Spirochaetota bacterium]